MENVVNLTQHTKKRMKHFHVELEDLIGKEGDDQSEHDFPTSKSSLMR